MGVKSVDNALDWLEDMGRKIPDLLDKNLSPREQAFQAAKMALDFKIAARNSMQDANAAVQLNVTDPLKAYAEYVEELEKQFGGTALYDRIIQASVLSTKRTPVKPNIDPGCFVAGTIVHTKEGLVPIEKIKVGDWVLSKPESGEGEQAYKRVTKTFVHDDKEVCLLTYVKYEGYSWRPDSKSWEGQLIVTSNHPFFVKNKGWKEAGQLKSNDVFEMSDGTDKTHFAAIKVLRATESEKDVAWILVDRDDLLGNDVDFRTYPFVIGTDQYYNAYANAYEGGNILRRVYNIEVENYHTYYVGEIGPNNSGILVHNKHHTDIAAIQEVAKNGLFTSDGIRVFMDDEAIINSIPGPNRGVISKYL